MKGWDHWGPPCPASPGRNALPLLLSWLSLLECLLALFLPLVIDFVCRPLQSSRQAEMPGELVDNWLPQA